MRKIEKFEEDGYCVLDLDDKQGVHEIHQLLLEELRSFLGTREVTLENYHELIGEDDRRHIAIQTHLTEKLRTEKWHVRAFHKNVSLFSELVGPDIDIEAAPYLRIVRPDKPQDCIGYHRDTTYGGSPYELSVFIPFLDLDRHSTLHVEAGSHQKSERDIPFKQIPSPDPEVTKGSVKHKLGFLYAPKILDENYPSDRLVPLPVRSGQVIVFSLALLHGAIVNTSSLTRWSCDTRMKNSFADPLLRTERFVPLARSPVTRAAEKYIRANQSQTVPLEKRL